MRLYNLCNCMKRPPLPYLLLLPLLAVLLFGNCGGTSVRRFLAEASPQRREKMRALVLQRQAERAEARQRLKGPARRDAYLQIEQRIDAHYDSLVPSNLFQTRRNKLDRQVLRLPPTSPVQRFE